MEHERDDSSEGGAVGTAVGGLWAGDLAEGEQENDIRGDAYAEDSVVDGDGGEAPEGEEDGERDDGPGRQAEVGRDKGGQCRAEDGSSSAGDGACEGFEESWLLNEQSGHGDPVAGLD